MPLAQLVEHLTFNQVVAGSIPAWHTHKYRIISCIFFADMAELADAPDLGSGGQPPCRFDSCYPHK